jgi:hypothetical protein
LWQESKLSSNQAMMIFLGWAGGPHLTEHEMRINQTTTLNNRTHLNQDYLIIHTFHPLSQFFLYLNLKLLGTPKIAWNTYLASSSGVHIPHKKSFLSFPLLISLSLSLYLFSHLFIFGILKWVVRSGLLESPKLGLWPRATGYNFNFKI